MSAMYDSTVSAASVAVANEEARAASGAVTDRVGKAAAGAVGAAPRSGAAAVGALASAALRAGIASRRGTDPEQPSAGRRFAAWAARAGSAVADALRPEVATVGSAARTAPLPVVRPVGGWSTATGRTAATAGPPGRAARGRRV
ncbi:hypothetical protein AB0I49_34540 [Streptomyces sp. NPDC050617]|uniref:hypothetical protein n=1 Tax=Streptomyces sp. NPDC050617 TaxID=3154628 RepID=UPI0034383B69